MLHLIAAGTFLCIGFWIGKKITNVIEYQTYTRGHELKKKIREKVWPKLKYHTPRLLASAKRGTGKGLRKLHAGYIALRHSA